MLHPFITPVLSRYISARLFSVPQVEIEVKGLHYADVAEIQEAVADELKKVQKEEFSVVFQKLYDRTKACIYTNGAYFEYKRYVSSLRILIFKKKSVLKLLVRTMYVRSSTTITTPTNSCAISSLCFGSYGF